MYGSFWGTLLAALYLAAFAAGGVFIAGRVFYRETVPFRLMMGRGRAYSAAMASCAVFVFYGLRAVVAPCGVFAACVADGRCGAASA